MTRAIMVTGENVEALGSTEDAIRPHAYRLRDIFRLCVHKALYVQMSWHQRRELVPSNKRQADGKGKAVVTPPRISEEKTRITGIY